MKRPTAPRLLLAPMEGLLDFVLRDVLTRVGGVDHCVSEFIRITDTLLPERVFARQVPELLHGSRTASGVPVRPQLLGSDPTCLAENAARLVAMGAAGVDLNFGCPSKVVNRHRGGAALLDEPDLLFQIVAAVRRAVPASLPVSAKMRLGLRDDARALDCARALQAGGASELVVHARTQSQGYRPPAYWERIAQIGQVVQLPLVANGEIWSAADAQRCREQSGCSDLMLGRGIVAYPGLALQIRAADDGRAASALDWHDVLALLADFWRLLRLHLQPQQQAGRLKQWLFLLQRHYPQAAQAFSAVRTLHAPQRVEHWLREQGVTNECRIGS